MSDQTETSPRQTRLNEVIAEYFAAVEAGNPPDREKFIEQHGSLAAELREFFSDGKMFERMARTLSIAPGAAAASAKLAAHGDRIRYFGDYELDEELARGGMGIVFKARQISLSRFVALKMILSGQFASSAEVLRFRSEAESAAALDHPNIVPIYEVGEHHSQHYFTMKLIDGGNIEQWASSHSPNQRQIATMMATIARAVHFGHQRGILHRDLKPGNVLVDSANVAYVVDFGIAKRVEADQGLTRTTDVMGSPAYMSPEQAAGKARDISVATDVYGLGAILYCLLSGRPPFVAESAAETLRLVLEADPPRPSAVRAGIDGDLQTICLKCIEKDPARRYPSAQAIADDLQRWLDGKPIVARPASRVERVVKWANRRPSLAALVAVSVVLLGVLVWVLPVSYLRVRRALARETEAHRRETLLVQENRDRLVQTSVTRGLEAMAANDQGAALIWFAHALRDETDPQRQRVLRTRITLGLGQMPRMRQLLTGDTPLCFTDDGKTLISLRGEGFTEAGAYRNFQGSTLIAHDLTHPRKLSQPPSAPPSGAINSLQGALARLMSRSNTPASTAATSGELTANVGQGTVFTEVATPETRLVQTTTVPGGTVLTFWEVTKLKALGSTSAQPNPPRHIGYSADGSRAAVLSQSPATGEASRETIDCFDVNSGAELGPPISITRGTNDPEIWVQINAAGDRIATVSKVEHADRSDGSLTATVWDIATAKAVFNAPVGPKRNYNPSHGGQAIFSADSSRLLTLYFSAMRTWDLHSGKPLSDEQFTNVDVDFGPGFIAPAGGFNANHTVWINQGTTIGFRAAEGGQPAAGSDLAAGGRLEEIAYSPNGGMFASVARLKTGHAVRLWGADYRHLLASQIVCADSTLPRVLFSPSGKRVAIASNWSPVTTQVRDTAPPTEQSSYPRLFKGTGWERALSPDGHRALSQVQAPQDASLYNLRITDLQTGKSIEFLSPVGSVVHASFSPDGSRIVVEGEFRTGPCAVAVLRSDDGKAVVNPFHPWPEEETSECYFVGFTSDGQWIVAEYDKRNQGDWRLNHRGAWSAVTGAKLDLGSATASQDVVSFSDDSHLVLRANHPRAYLSSGAGVQVWDVTTGKPVSGALPQGVDCARFSPDSRYLLLYGRKISTESLLTLYEVATTREVWSVKTDCTHLAFSPDGLKIAVSSDSATEVRSASDGSLLSRPINRGVAYNDFDPVGSMRFSADGLLLIFASTRSGAGAQIFDARTGEIVATIAMEESWQSIAAPVFPDRDRMLLVHDSKPVEISFAPDARDADRLEMIIHLLSSRKLDSDGRLAPLSAEEMAKNWDALIASGEPEVGEPAAPTGR